ncbi:LppU/SCO3897 family protein [Asanoa iriomotensis]|uniref:Subtilisin inhibitor-like n=1 Tax=Asanoa iriomotensis TaxID=234613 RepID=A0ABQ4CDR1_9ACTN|nr:hypothetical protein [Asanoa iriomotensis]GIF60909.1 hypothetical protein Air01nite_70040 [Asanoa iriomotensis]
MSDQATPSAAPQAGGSFAPPADAPAPEPAKPAKGKNIGKILLRVAVPIVVVVAGVAWKFLSGDPATAATGDCLIEAASADDMKTVGCDDPTASWKVAGKVENVKEADFDASQNSCTAYPTAEASLWMGKKGRDGDVLCLEPLKK